MGGKTEGGWGVSTVKGKITHFLMPVTNNSSDTDVNFAILSGPPFMQFLHEFSIELGVIFT